MQQDLGSMCLNPLSGYLHIGQKLLEEKVEFGEMPGILVHLMKEVSQLKK